MMCFNRGSSVLSDTFDFTSADYPNKRAKTAVTDVRCFNLKNRGEYLVCFRTGKRVLLTLNNSDLYQLFENKYYSRATRERVMF